MSKIPLIYILSNGRSGTTLLDLLLGAHPRIWTVGEAQYLPWELVNPKSPCGDGEYVEESSFWKKLLPEIPTEIAGYHVGYFLNEEHLGKVLRWEILPDLLRGSVSSQWQPAVEEYGRKNAQFFEVVHEAAEAFEEKRIRWLVDASKCPYRLFWLSHSGYFDIRVIHLVKDPRAFVYSMVRKQPAITTGKIIRFTGRWIVENAIMQQLCKNSFQGYRVWQQHYEDLARDPGKTLEAIGNWLGLDYAPEMVNSFRDYDNFAISGNAMRLRTSNREIRLDERWKSGLSSSYAGLIKAATRPFASHCGYPSFTSN